MRLQQQVQGKVPEGPEGCGADTEVRFRKVQKVPAHILWTGSGNIKLLEIAPGFSFCKEFGTLFRSSEMRCGRALSCCFFGARCKEHAGGISDPLYQQVL